MVVKAALSAGFKQLTKGLSKKAAKETVSLFGRQTLEEIGELVARNPEKAGYVAEVLKKQDFKGLNELQQEAASMTAKSRSASLKNNFVSGPRQQGVIPITPEVRQGIGQRQIAEVPTTRAESIPPNLPQEVIDEYTQESATRLRAGEKNRTDVPYLVDNDDRVYRLDQKGWEYDGDIKQKKYALIDVDLKRARNAKLNKVRADKGNITTRAGVDQREFYADPDPSARHVKGKEEPHHRAPLHPTSRIKKGLTVKEQTQVDSLLEEVGIVLGNDKFNRDNLPKSVHKKLHSWLKKNKLLLGDKDLTKLSLRQRRKYIRQFIAEMKQSDEKTYKLMQEHARTKKR